MPRNQTFGDLLKAGISSIVYCEGKTAPVVEEDLGQLVGVGPGSIQRYKAGNVPPELRSIEILAEACVSRGFLGRPWLERFLHAARHPAPEKLLDRLCPLGPVRPRPPRVYENLPAPTYSQFVMREVAFAEVLDGLGQRSAAVLIVGLGGNGKTSLAREVAAHCLRDDEDAPRFDAAVWVSDKDRPGTTNLSIVLDEIARTLDYPGFTQFDHEEKRREVEQLLRRQRVLLVVDNFETITDEVLLAWLLRLPEPSKVIVTTREYRREFRRGGWPVELRGMSEAEAWELISGRARVLKIEQVVADQHLIEQLVVATGGNPKALTMTIGLVKYERRPLQQVIDDLYAARGELFDDLFARAWALLDEAARRVLLGATLFLNSASSDALGATADVHGFALERALERLADLAFVDPQQHQLNKLPRYMLHPLVRTFAAAQAAEILGFEAARERWLRWYSELASRIGYCPGNLALLELLDPEQDTVLVAAQWAADQEYNAIACELASNISYYYFFRGLWEKHLYVLQLWSETARRMGDIVTEVRARSYFANLLIRRDSLDEALQQLDRIEQLASNASLPIGLQPDRSYSYALYWTARGELDRAEQLWRDGLALTQGQGTLQATDPFLTHEPFHFTSKLAQCLYQQGRVEEAYVLMMQSLQDGGVRGYQRIYFTMTQLALLHIQRGAYDEAATLLATIEQQAQGYQDRPCIAHVRYQIARLHALQGDIPAARAALAEAIDLFERLGMRRELAEARLALTDLEIRAASELDAARE